MYKVIVHPSAEEDINSAFDWYEEQKLNLGKEFILEVRQKVNFLKHNPQSSRIRYDDLRISKAGKKFPYFIHYRIDKSNKLIGIMGVYHGKQNPNKWKERLGKI